MIRTVAVLFRRQTTSTIFIRQKSQTKICYERLFRRGGPQRLLSCCTSRPIKAADDAVEYPLEVSKISKWSVIWKERWKNTCLENWNDPPFWLSPRNFSCVGIWAWSSAYFRSKKVNWSTLWIMSETGLEEKVENMNVEEKAPIARKGGEKAKGEKKKKEDASCGFPLEVSRSPFMRD